MQIRCFCINADPNFAAVNQNSSPESEPGTEIYAGQPEYQ